MVYSLDEDHVAPRKTVILSVSLTLLQMLTDSEPQFLSMAPFLDSPYEELSMDVAPGFAVIANAPARGCFSQQ